MAQLYGRFFPADLAPEFWKNSRIAVPVIQEYPAPWLNNGASSRWFNMTFFLGCLSDPFKGWKGDLHLGDQKVTNWITWFISSWVPWRFVDVGFWKDLWFGTECVKKLYPQLTVHRLASVRWLKCYKLLEEVVASLINCFLESKLPLPHGRDGHQPYSIGV